MGPNEYLGVESDRLLGCRQVRRGNFVSSLTQNCRRKFRETAGSKGKFRSTTEGRVEELENGSQRISLNSTRLMSSCKRSERFKLKSAWAHKDSKILSLSTLFPVFSFILSSCLRCLRRLLCFLSTLSLFSLQLFIGSDRLDSSSAQLESV